MPKVPPTLISCPTCGKETANTAKTCPSCGAKIAGGTAGFWIGAAIIVVLLAAWLIWGVAH